MGSLFKAPKPPPPPELPKQAEEPVEMPDPNDPSRKLAERKRLARLVRASGRKSAQVRKRANFG